MSYTNTRAHMLAVMIDQNQYIVLQRIEYIVNYTVFTTQYYIAVIIIYLSSVGMYMIHEHDKNKSENVSKKKSCAYYGST